MHIILLFAGYMGASGCIHILPGIDCLELCMRKLLPMVSFFVVFFVGLLQSSATGSLSVVVDSTQMLLGRHVGWCPDTMMLGNNYVLKAWRSGARSISAGGCYCHS